MSADHKSHFEDCKKNSVKTEDVIRQERAMYHQYWRCSSIDYIRYGLYSKNLTKDEILDYIPTYIFYTQYLKDVQAGVNEDIYGDKLHLFHLFHSNGIPTPNVMAVVYNGHFTTAVGENVTEEKLFGVMQENTKYFFKPTDGAGGNGIHVLKNVRTIEELKTFIASLTQNVTYVVQLGLIQRDDIAAINSSSVNTLRIVTQYIGKAPIVKTAIMRLGRNHSDVDNSTQGGISCAINVDNGCLADYATAEHGGGIYLAHPDSGYVFKGHQIEDWQKIRSTVERYANKFPELKNIGWDIALTTDGICVIEMNLGFGIEHQQVVCGGMRRILNVYPKHKEIQMKNSHNITLGGGKRAYIEIVTLSQTSSDYKMAC